MIGYFNYVQFNLICFNWAYLFKNKTLDYHTIIYFWSKYFIGTHKFKKLHQKLTKLKI